MGRTKKDKTLKSNEEKTISYLLRKARLKGVTQTEIAKEIEVSQPTVSSFIDGLCGITRSYRGVKYEIKKIGGKYIAFNEEYLSAHSSAGKKLSQTRKEPKNNNIQNDKINEVTAIDKLEREYSAYFYAYPARTADKAIRLTRSVVAFPVVQRMRKEVIARIRSSFGE